MKRIIFASLVICVVFLSCVKSENNDWVKNLFMKQIFQQTNINPVVVDANSKVEGCKKSNIIKADFNGDKKDDYASYVVLNEKGDLPGLFKVSEYIAFLITTDPNYRVVLYPVTKSTRNDVDTVNLSISAYIELMNAENKKNFTKKVPTYIGDAIYLVVCDYNTKIVYFDNSGKILDVTSSED